MDSRSLNQHHNQWYGAVLLSVHQIFSFGNDPIIDERRSGRGGGGE